MNRPPVTALGDLAPPDRRRVILRLLGRAGFCAVVQVVIYYVIPLKHIGALTSLVLLTVAICGVFAVLGWQVRAILRADFPGLRAVQAVAMVIPLFLLSFSTLYYLMDVHTHGSFSQGLTRTDALYFTVTTFSTTGYGDITPTSAAARVAVMIQMLADLAIIGFGVKLLLGAVQFRRQGGSSSARL